MAASKGMLLWAAPILPLFPVFGLLWLRSREELIGWALFTVWLGSTYAASGSTAELTVFGLITLLAIAGIIFSPWLFVVAWFAHIVWDFMPRELPDLLHDLPIACMIFDGLIALYLSWRIHYSPNRFKRFASLRPDTTISDIENSAGNTV
ncbi:MAG: hypothetical protein KUG72_00685 [Pseudomonadales bacterium]|nr:hypothetical protein [Pseudomonadales bacterium]